ncbi:MAG: hypothetical protein R3C52_10785 [Hyphomonadaceae bacterium]
MTDIEREFPEDEVHLEAVHPVVDDMTRADDFSVMSFRIVSDCGPKVRVFVDPFELATLLARLGEIHRHSQINFLNARLGAPGAGLGVAGFQVDADRTARSVSLQLLPRGTDTRSLGYSLSLETARRIAHELLAAADQIERSTPPAAN